MGFVWWLVPIAGLLAIWQLTVMLKLVDETLLPSPATVGKALVDLFVTGEIWPHVFASLQRGLVGFVVATVICVPLGILIGWFKSVERVLAPLIELFRQLPSLAMFPIFLLFLGIGFQSQLAMVVWASAWPILLTTITGTRSVDPRLIKAAMTLGAEQKDLFLRVVIPSAVPYIATGLRLGGSFAFLVLVGAEMIGADAGIGYLVISSQQLFKIPDMFAALVVLGVIGLAINYGLIAGERRISKWRQTN
ncbi:ABC transporter permease [Dactylosporangium sp. NPDC050688]|uniref:ABC transporter permease n=1 Tax=Dactylosporangium sp. NPDC050688 TaxID=3157217 RepID=UPI0033D64E52